MTPRFFYSVGQLDEAFEPVSDEEVVVPLHLTTRLARFTSV
jgi:hypothetical protein